MPPLKVFISYSNLDRTSAESLYGDLRAAGAEPFEFGQSATGDSAAFSEIIRWISICDAFVVLISANALGSFAVLEEIRTANHRYINSLGTHPAKIIPLIIEKGAAPPLDIERFSQIELHDYGAGRSTLFRRLGLEQPAPALVAPAPVLESIDFDTLAREHAQSRPSDQTNWFERASKLLESYKDLKPVELPKEEEAHHVDSLLARMSGQSPSQFADLEQVAPVEEAFLGVEPSTSGLSERLIGFDASKRQVPLSAPLLRNEDDTFRWTAVLGATGYVLERSVAGLGAQEVYRGTELSFTLPLFEALYRAADYRVKATGGVFREDSPWSDTVQGGVSLPLSFEAPAKKLVPHVPPLLDLDDLGFGTTITWSAVDGAKGYILERTLRAMLSLGDKWKVVYEGDGKMYVDFDRMGKTGALYGYRVRAHGPWGATDWSDEVMG